MPTPHKSLLFLLNLLANFLVPISNSNSHFQNQFPCKPPYHNHYPFCNSSLPTATRAHSLLSLLTLSDKIRQLSNAAAAVPSLGLPAYQWWSEALHGVAINGPGVSFAGAVPSATSFPQVILSAASFNRSLWRAVAAATAAEARSMHNVGQAGLTFWAPTVNIFRDPRWGRGQETPGEDPLVASDYAVEFVRGFQGFRSDFGARVSEKRTLEGDGEEEGLMLSACCKHFMAYDLEKWGSFSRYNFNAVVCLGLKLNSE